MRVKIIALMLAVINLTVCQSCLAGETSISGPAYCYIPQQLEFQEQIPQEHSADIIPPDVSGANGEYEIQKEIIQDSQKQKALENENDIVQIEEKTTRLSHEEQTRDPNPKIKYETVVYTIYAR